jgi:hypothetical protein
MSPNRVPVIHPCLNSHKRHPPSMNIENNDRIYEPTDDESFDHYADIRIACTSWLRERGLINNQSSFGNATVIKKERNHEPESRLGYVP